MMYVRQSHYLINSIVQYFSSISTYVFVLVRRYAQIAGYPQYRIIEFSIARETCSSKVLEKVKNVYSNQGNLNFKIYHLYAPSIKVKQCLTKFYFYNFSEITWYHVSLI